MIEHGVRILVLEPVRFDPRAMQELGEIGRVDLGPLDRCELLERVGRYDVLVIRLGHRIDAEVLQAADRLRYLLCPTTGLDHIDEALAASRGVEVISLRGDTEFLRTVPATAEHTWALLLALARRLPFAHASVLRGEWNRDVFRGHDLAGRNLLIVGLGRVGERVESYGRAFGMETAAFDPVRSGVWPSGVRRFDLLVEALSWADVVTLHVPLDNSTETLFGAAELRFMRTDAVLINTSRGAVVDESALLDALASGDISGAALDVLGTENRLETPSAAVRNYAAANENLVLTPHIGGATYESMATTERRVVSRLAALMAPDARRGMTSTRFDARERL